MSHGFEIRRADGSIALSSRETLFRFIHAEKVAADFAGTFSVPGFDGDETSGSFTAKGFFYVQYEISPRGYGFGGTPDNEDQPILGSMLAPSLTWNNTTKVMTVAPASIPSGWPLRTRPDYEVIFMHFR